MPKYTTKRKTYGISVCVYIIIQKKTTVVHFLMQDIAIHDVLPNKTEIHMKSINGLLYNHVTSFVIFPLHVRVLIYNIRKQIMTTQFNISISTI